LRNSFMSMSVRYETGNRVDESQPGRQKHYCEQLRAIQEPY
jgi:hypothetical protein